MTKDTDGKIEAANLDSFLRETISKELNRMTELARSGIVMQSPECALFALLMKPTFVT